MPRLIWTLPALADVQRLYQFLALKDADAAQHAVKAVRAGAKMLAHQPHIGRPLEDMEPEFREWLIDLGNRAMSPSIASTGGISPFLPFGTRKRRASDDNQDRDNVYTWLVPLQRSGPCRKKPFSR